jgi:hypothetical protein
MGEIKGSAFIFRVNGLKVIGRNPIKRITKLSDLLASLAIP